MAGHSHWKQIKHQKGATDQKRGQLFSKLLKAVAVAARDNPNPQFNAGLRTAIQKAKENQVPQDNIEKAVSRASEQSENLEELLIEAYGPGGIALIIESLTDNRNRTVTELKQIFKEHETKMAEPGSVRWAFEAPNDNQTEWLPKFRGDVKEEDAKKILELVRALETHDDVQKIYHNAKP